MIKDKDKLSLLLLKIGLAFVLIYAATSSFINPDNWIGWFPMFVRNLIPANILLPMFSISEIILALWVLSGKWLFYSSLLTAFATAGIVVFNLNQMDIVFRDVAIMLMALSLAVSSKTEAK